MNSPWRSSETAVRNLPATGFLFTCLWLLGIMLLQMMPALADGKVFSGIAIEVPVSVSDQRALIHYSNGVERLVIETSFVGQGTNFAWVVPLPSVPTMEPVSEYFFKRLAVSFQPEINFLPNHEWISVLAIGMGIMLCIYLDRHRGKLKLADYLAVLFFVLIIIAMLLPSFVSERGSAPGIRANISVSDNIRIGNYDGVVLSGTDSQAIVAWMKTNGFRLPDTALPIIGDYVKQGWCFAAIKLRPSLTGGKVNPHPVAFTFRVEQPVYPMRLTGVENDRCDLELYVFGTGRASAGNLAVDYCGVPSFVDTGTRTDSPSFERFRLARAGVFSFEETEVRKWTAPAPVVTRLRGTLTAQDMKSDMEIQWRLYRRQFPVYFTLEGAIDSTLNWLVMMSIPGLTIIYAFFPSNKRKRVAIGWTFLAVIMATLRFATASILNPQDTRVIFPRSSFMNFRQLEAAVHMWKMEREAKIKKGEPVLPMTFENLESELGEFFNNKRNPNVFTGEPILNQPTPGNFTLHPTPEGIQVLWYDIRFIPYVLTTMTNSPTAANSSPTRP